MRPLGSLKSPGFFNAVCFVDNVDQWTDWFDINNFIFFPPASAVNLEGELFKDLMKGYNKNVRPMEKSGDITQVDIKMTLTNLISLVSRFVDFILISFFFTSQINNI